MVPDIFSFIREDDGTYLMDIVVLIGIELLLLFTAIQLSNLVQSNPPYQQAVNVGLIYGFMNILTIGYFAGGYFTRQDDNSVFRPIGIGVKPWASIPLFIIGLILGILFTAQGKLILFTILHPAAAGASIDILTSTLFKDFVAPFSETYFVVGFLLPVLYIIFGGRSGDFIRKGLAFLAASVLACSIITVFHLVVDANALSEMPVLFAFFWVQCLLSMLLGSIVMALGMHFGLNLVLPGLAGEPEYGLEYAKTCQPSLNDALFVRPLRNYCM